jgi:hypothetical protein
MEKNKKMVKVGPTVPFNKIVRHMPYEEIQRINYKMDGIRAVISMVFYMADGDILGGCSEGLVKIVDNILMEFDELRRDINGETEQEEMARIRKERDQKAA